MAVLQDGGYIKQDLAVFVTDFFKLVVTHHQSVLQNRSTMSGTHQMAFGRSDKAAACPRRLPGYFARSVLGNQACQEALCYRQLFARMSELRGQTMRSCQKVTLSQNRQTKKYPERFNLHRNTVVTYSCEVMKAFLKTHQPFQKNSFSNHLSKIKCIFSSMSAHSNSTQCCGLGIANASSKSFSFNSGRQRVTVLRHQTGAQVFKPVILCQMLSYHFKNIVKVRTLINFFLLLCFFFRTQRGEKREVELRPNKGSTSRSFCLRRLKHNETSTKAELVTIHQSPEECSVSKSLSKQLWAVLIAFPTELTNFHSLALYSVPKGGLAPYSSASVSAGKRMAAMNSFYVYFICKTRLIMSNGRSGALKEYQKNSTSENASKDNNRTSYGEGSARKRRSGRRGTGRKTQDLHHNSEEVLQNSHPNASSVFEGLVGMDNAPDKNKNFEFGHVPGKQHKTAVVGTTMVETQNAATVQNFHGDDKDNNFKNNRDIMTLAKCRQAQSGGISSVSREHGSFRTNHNFEGRNFENDSKEKQRRTNDKGGRAKMNKQMMKKSNLTNLELIAISTSKTDARSSSQKDIETNGSQSAHFSYSAILDQSPAAVSNGIDANDEFKHVDTEHKGMVLSNKRRRGRRGGRRKRGRDQNVELSMQNAILTTQAPAVVENENHCNVETKDETTNGQEDVNIKKRKRGSRGRGRKNIRTTQPSSSSPQHEQNCLPERDEPSI